MTRIARPPTSSSDETPMTSVDAEVLRDSTEQTGAVVMGRRLFDIIDGPNVWNDEMAYGAGHAATPPVFVVTHDPPATTRLDGFTFVTDGIAAAIDAARTDAGGRNVVVMGGAEVVRQSVDLGLADELRLHIAPILLGAGTPLFTGVRRRELTARSARWTRHAAHVIYDLS